MPTGIKIFISYAHENKALRNELEEKLAPLGRTGLVFIWSDQNLNPGVLWANEIKTQLHSAEVILLLITPEFMNSLYCYIEADWAMERHEAKEALVIPVILEPANWQSASFSNLQALPNGGKPVSEWENRRDAFLDLAKGIQRAIKNLPHGSDSSRRYTTDPSRRFFLVGLASGLIGLLVGGGATYWLTATHFSGLFSQSPTYLPFSQSHTYLGHSNEVDTVAWAPNGNFVTSGSRDKTVQVWNPFTGDHLLTYTNHNDAVYAVAWSPDSKQIASASVDQTVQVWNFITGNRTLTYTLHEGALHAVAWSLDGKKIASGSDDRTVRVWDASTGKNLITYKGHTDQVHAVAWSPDGKYLASGGVDKTVQVWDSKTGNLVLTYTTHSAEVDTVAWSPNGKYIASGSFDHSARVWDVATGGRTFSFTYRGHSDIVRSVAWSPDGKRLASGSADGMAHLWDIIGNNIYIYRGHRSWVHCVVWSPDGKYIASSSADHTVQVWQPPT